MTGRPTSTPWAPNASALRMSVPRRKEPSTRTGALPATASTIFGSDRIGAGLLELTSPYVDTTTPSAPFCSANRAISGVVTPLTSTGTFTPRLRAATAAQSTAATVAAALVPGPEGTAPTVTQIALQPAFTAS